MPRARDVRGRWIVLARPAQRIVSLVPSLTELVCWLGAQHRLVGVTRYCTHPPAVARMRPRVGGTKNPDCAAVISLRPDLVIANAEENRREDIATLEAAGLTVFVTFPTTVPASAAMIERIGRLIGTPQRAVGLALRIRKQEAKARRDRLVRVFCPIWRNPWMTFNHDTYAHDMLRRAGGINVCADYGVRYPEVSLATVAELAPQVIFLPSEPYRFTERHVADLSALRGTPAYRDRRIHLVDGQALSWYGPRTPAAIAYFRRYLCG